MTESDDDKHNAALWLDFELRLAILSHLVGKHLHEEVLTYDLIAGPAEHLILPAVVAQNRFEHFFFTWNLQRIAKLTKGVTENDIAAALFYLAENQYVRCIDKRFCLTKSGWEYLNSQLDMVQTDATNTQLRDQMMVGFERNDNPFQPSFFTWERHGGDWNDNDLQIAILRVLSDAHKKRPLTGGASAKMIMDVLELRDLKQIELSIRNLLTKGYIEMGDRLFLITHAGIEFLNQQPQRTTFH
jgi:hypothetical protein